MATIDGFAAEATEIAEADGHCPRADVLVDARGQKLAPAMSSAFLRAAVDSACGRRRRGVSAAAPVLLSADALRVRESAGGE